MSICRSILILLIAKCFIFADTSTLKIVDTFPNVVLIMADDVGLGDISYHVRNIMELEPAFETPSIDSLARQGMWFTDGHSATALCSPTRYCVMSGNNNYRSHAPMGCLEYFCSKSL